MRLAAPRQSLISDVASQSNEIIIAWFCVKAKEKFHLQNQLLAKKGRKKNYNEGTCTRAR